MKYGSRIIGTGSGFPERVMTNKEFEAFVDTTDEWIRTRTGIETRRVANLEAGETTLTFAHEAAKKAIKMADISPQDIELIIIGTVTPDNLMPTTANQLQALLGAKRAFTFDLQAACSGFLYGLSIADQFISNGKIKNALIIGAETLSTLVNWRDRSTCVLFGDGAGAVVLARTEDPAHRVLATRVYSDGTQGELLSIPHGQGKVPPHSKEYSLMKQKVHMRGREIFKVAVKSMVDVSRQVLDDCGMTLEDVDFFLFHQANMRIIELCARILHVDPKKTWNNLHKYGNTSAATLPICLDEAWKAGAVKPGDKILMSTFGGGLTWGSALVQL